jgi:hypothetical protein
MIISLQTQQGIHTFLVSELAPFSASDFEMALLQSIYFAKISRLKSSPHLQPLSKSLLRHLKFGIQVQDVMNNKVIATISAD